MPIEPGPALSTLAGNPEHHFVPPENETQLAPALLRHQRKIKTQTIGHLPQTLPEGVRGPEGHLAQDDEQGG